MNRIIQFILVLGALLALAGCGPHEQSILDPRSPEAREIARLWWAMCIVYSVIFVAVLWFVFRAVRGKRGSEPPGGAMGFVVAGGIVLPSVVLVGFLIYSLRVSIAIAPPESGMTIEVNGHQWWWEVRYPELGIVTANELHIPAGERVRIRLYANDVIHSFWVPNLHGKLDMLPEQTNTIWIQAEEPGVWRGQCAEFCGTQHALMALMVIGHERAEFDQWAAERQKASSVYELEGSPGEELFFRHGCQDCHAIQGSDAVANLGPDLTHLANRRTLAAAAVPNNRGNLSGWIANPQTIKPGSRMPATYMDSEELHTLVDYLLSLDAPQ